MILRVTNGKRFLVVHDVTMVAFVAYQSYLKCKVLFLACCIPIFQRSHVVVDFANLPCEFRKMLLGVSSLGQRISTHQG